MSDNKLHTLFETLTGVEKRSCTYFLESPYLNQRADVLALWKYIVAEKSAEVDPKTGFAIIYPASDFDDSKWRYLQSFLTQKIEQFLVQRAWEESPVLADLHLAPIYRQKGLFKPLQHILRRADIALSKQQSDLQMYHDRYRLEWEAYAADESGSRMRETNLATVARSLDIYLVGSKLRLACLMESHRAVYNIDYDTRFLPQLIEYVPTSDLIEIPLIALYFYCFKAIKDGEESDFSAFKQELERQSSHMPDSERRTFLLLAINYCIRRMNSGAQMYRREAFEIYQLGLQTGILIENGVLSRFAFKNIAALALQLDAFEWTEQFIGAYGQFLEPRYRDAYQNYNLARLYFTQKNYKKAMPLLAQVDESDLLLNLDSRIMLVKMYYDIGELDALDALLSSFRLYLFRKKKVIGYHQINYLQTLRLVHQLTRIKRNDKKALATFREKVLRSTAVIEKNWLLSLCEG